MVMITTSPECFQRNFVNARQLHVHNDFFPAPDAELEVHGIDATVLDIDCDRAETVRFYTTQHQRQSYLFGFCDDVLSLYRVTASSVELLDSRGNRNEFTLRSDWQCSHLRSRLMDHRPERNGSSPNSRQAVRQG